VAQPGEFTRRALLHGKLDLAQAEAIADLIDANSEPMRRAALGTVGGVLSRRIAELRAALLQLEAVVAYGVDFPEEDEAEIPRQQIIAMGEDVAGRIGALLETAGRGSILRQGALVVFAGPPNAGKSSLFNALLGQDRAIVTDTPGTTRDAIEQSCMIGDWPVRLVDTAGLRPSNNLIERLGIEISERYVRDAEVCIVCSDGSGPRLDVLMRGVRSLGAQSVIAAETKSDLRAARGSSTEGIWVSAATGAGLADLRRAIARRLDERYGAMDFESPIITRARHSAMLGEAVRELHLFCDSMRANATPTIAAVHLRSAVVALEEIIGAVSVDDLLDEVFSRFCVGK
jgi:tRNA modification GTPase